MLQTLDQTATEQDPSRELDRFEATAETRSGDGCDGCDGCDRCDGAARDEMWSRWA